MGSKKRKSVSKAKPSSEGESGRMDRHKQKKDKKATVEVVEQESIVSGTDTEETSLPDGEVITEEMVEELKSKVAARLTEEDYADDDDDDDDDGSSENADDTKDERKGGEKEDENDEQSSSDEEDYDEQPDLAIKMQLSDGKYRNKQRCLLLSSRGVTSRYRHFLEDLRTLVPHHKKDSKLDVKHGDNGGVGRAVNEIADIKGCNSVVFLECRKRGQDAYLWMGYTATAAVTNSAINSFGGPSVKFHLSNIHTMDELRMTGNCMRGSRPVLTFDSSFDKVDHLKLLKVMLTDVFGTPRGHPKSKPFVDRVMGFYYADRKIWVRNYQINDEQASNAKEAAELKNGGLNTQLVEIGPRFVLNPIRIFNGSFGGQTLYTNPDYVSPNIIRAQSMQNKGQSYQNRKQAQRLAKERKENIVLPNDPLAKVFH